MFKLNEKSWEGFGKGLQAAFGDPSASTVHFYRPEALQAANRPSEVWDLAAKPAAPAPTQVTFTVPAAA